MPVGARGRPAAAAGGNRPWGYLRLRLETYSDADLDGWAERLAATHWQQVHAYFMHEPTAPGYAAALLARLAPPATSSPPSPSA